MQRRVSHENPEHPTFGTHCDTYESGTLGKTVESPQPLVREYAARNEKFNAAANKLDCVAAARHDEACACLLDEMAEYLATLGPDAEQWMRIKESMEVHIANRAEITSQCLAARNAKQAAFRRRKLGDNGWICAQEANEMMEKHLQERVRQNERSSFH